MTTNQTENDDFSGAEADNLIYAFATDENFALGQGGTVFAATSTGLLRSTDGGKTWNDPLTSLQLSETLPVTSLTIIANDNSASTKKGQIVIAGSVGGFFRSIDTGISWQMLVFPSPPPTVSSLAYTFNSNGEEVIFAGTMEDGVFISLDSGLHWAAWNFGMLDLNVLCVEVSPNFAQDETVFAGTETGLFRSTNGGRAWRDFDLPFGFDPVISIACAPDGALIIGTESKGLWSTSDEGKNWQQLGAFEEPINNIIFSKEPDHSGDLLIMTSSALLRSTDSGASWTNCLPEKYTDWEMSALLTPLGIGPGAPVLVGFMDGSIGAIRLI